MHSNYYIVLIALSSVVLISHFFNMFSKVSRIPSVLLLIGLGILIRNVSGYFNVEVLNSSSYVHLLGTMGLILIVLEGALDLKIKKEKFSIIRGALGAAAVILLIATTGIAMLFHLWLNADLRSSFVNAIPFGIISSAIAIPTVINFIQRKKEFLTYEAVFSDILGIMFFNFMVTPSTLNFSAYTDFFSKFLIVIVVSIAGSYLLFWCLHNMKVQAKFFLVLSLLVLVYSIGKLLHLSSLLLVFSFGLVLNNPSLSGGMKVRKQLDQEEINKGLEQFKLIVSELAFLIRTFFFVIFGYSMSMASVFSLNVFMLGMAVIIILYLVRYVYLKFIVREHIFPEIFIAPKGLVTVLLFYSIPQSLVIPSFGDGAVVFFVILVTSILMIASGFSKEHLNSEAV